MHVIVLKYMQVLCITIFFSNNINCDKLLLHNEREDQDLYRIGACTAACMAGTEVGVSGEPNETLPPISTEQLKTIGHCYKLCSEDTRPLSAWIPLVQRQDPSLRINLICRDSTNLIIEIKPERNGHSVPGVVEDDGEVVEATTAMMKLSPPGGNQNQLSALHDAAVESRESVPSRTRRAIGADGPSGLLQKGGGSVATRANLLQNPDQSVSGERFTKIDGPARNTASAAHGDLGDVAVKVQQDRANYQPSSKRVRPLPIYLVKVQDSEEELGDRIVYMCPYTKVQRISAEKKHTVLKIDATRPIGLRVLDRDVGKYSFDNDTALCQFSNAQLGEFGVYDLSIAQDAGSCKLETAKEPVNIYLPFVTIAIIALIAFGIVRLARYGLYRSRMGGFQQPPSRPEEDAGGGDAPTSADENDKQETATSAQVTPKKRLQSLDTFRGIAIMLMIFVNSGGGHYWWIEHATWNGLHVADLVFPWFLFIMGVCVPISLRGQINRNVPRRRILSNIAVSNASLVKIENLVPNKRYNVTATMLTSAFEYYYVEKHQFRTLPLDYMPGTITEITVERFEPNVRDSRYVDALISWNPAKDKTCHYEIVCHASHSPDFQLKPIDVQQPEVLYKYTIKSLKLSANYMVAVRSKNTQNAMKESKLHWHSFHTPSCANLMNGTQVCAPEPIKNVRVTQLPLYGDSYQLNISWDRPAIAPDAYVVKVFDLHDSETEEPANSMTRNLTGDAVGLLIDSFDMFGPHFEVFISAYSRVGVSSESTIKTLQIGRISSESWIRTKLVFIILAPVLMIGLLKISISLICRRRAKLKRYEVRCEYFKELEQKAPVDPSTEFESTSKQMQDLLASSHPFSADLIAPINDELEIDMEHIKLQDMLGEGAFGLVRRGMLQRETEGDGATPKPVAVKMLKECPRVEDIIEFRREMEVMKSVGTHPHIVSIVGHCTKNVRKMMLLTEYCGRGNLLNYLRLQWQRLLKQNRTTLPLGSGMTSPSMVPDSLDGAALSGGMAAEHECLTPSLANNKMPENVFNFDTSFVNDKKSLTYKNLSSDHRQTLLAGFSTSDGCQRSPQIIENKLYPLFNEDSGGDETAQLTAKSNFCTSSCKNAVEIIDGQRRGSMGKDCEGSVKSNVRIKPCSCHGSALDSTLTHNTVENRCYQSCAPSEDGFKEDDPPPNSGQLLEFCRQIALGMEFLARNKVVHRDLAARNVLVCDNNTVKIADFGLSRDIYQENLYRKTSNGKLPIKWLALESMTHQVYTSQSDVWSFGILLYEICTLGGSPYPSISTNKLLRYLESGYRMERPNSCNELLYDLMYSCWNVHPGERPTFSKIVHTVESLQEKDAVNEPIIIDLNAIVESHCTKSATEENSYLKPVEY